MGRGGTRVGLASGEPGVTAADGLSFTLDLTSETMIACAQFLLCGQLFWTKCTAARSADGKPEKAPSPATAWASPFRDGSIRVSPEIIGQLPYLIALSDQFLVDGNPESWT
jgi:hypothetical protein